MSISLGSKFTDFYVVRSGESIRDINRRFYGKTWDRDSLGTLVKNNPHLSNLNNLQRDQILDVGPAHAFRSLNHRDDLLQLERIYRSLSNAEKHFIHEKPHFLELVQESIVPIAYNIPGSTFATIHKLVGKLSQAVKDHGEGLNKYYVEGPRGELQSELMSKVIKRWKVELALSKIPRKIEQSLLRYSKEIQSPLQIKLRKIEAEINRQLKLRPKLPSGYNPYSKYLERYSKVLRESKFWGNAFTWVIPIGQGVWDSYQAYGTPRFRQTLRENIASISTSAALSEAGLGLCSVIFSAPSWGSSVFWCGILAGAVGSYWGNTLGISWEHGLQRWLNTNTELEKMSDGSPIIAFFGVIPTLGGY